MDEGDELVEMAVTAAHAAGALLLDRFGQVQDVQTKSSVTDPVSEADRAAERLLVQTLRGARPADGLLGEEGADREGTTGLRWVLDPLDGTVNYLYGLPGWAVSVACERRSGDAWTAVAGVVHDPLRGETFRAGRGRGAWLADRALRVRQPVPLARALVATGFSYSADERREQAAIVAALLPQIRDVRRLGAAALDLCYVAAGRFDAYFEQARSRWDWAAGALIAAEAGAVVDLPVPGDSQAAPAAGLPESLLLAATPELAAPLRTALAAAAAVTAGG